ncbi:UPF0161 protein At3g09310 [Mangifera indica]|uniref:UPF0161 protein At3g09310 n=1 Tax=Mangifera indica TaxID=29780 RepID=UPI001CFAFC04|nr:UPF0161 protein At3g09310 [Mangifera indica]XP_044494932.1 UPF0161 protein At3g09310 [Mangifera indica]XP_044494940.1 UPF0161 protein At3g09310 [Mangifera indica]XP_044494948.1 UPF0161 protein At3g09310 [Mangifera indica]XP_044494956.1 UPF0161 protein At3g09310 [Mangifera indica]XP_044494964.1 UPF0161 protein At3g09310 [Mangifera indica]XP_044494972.1 UPF0161 protein At3g09310 [Mangifera indica]
MAVVMSLNVHKPFSTTELQFQNPSFNSIKYQRKNQNLHCRFFIPPKSKSYRSLIVNGLSSDSDQNTPRDNEVDNVGVKAALSMLRFYKREISPILPKSCRYVPTCSEYSMQAYKKYGVVKGSILTAWRLCRCNPLGGSGFDPPRWFDEEHPPEQ